MQRSFNLDALAAEYARSRFPDAAPAVIAAAIRRLRNRIDRGELQVDEVAQRLQAKLHAPASKSPSSFGDLARAARDLDGGRLSMTERNFVAAMCAHGFKFTPSPRQAQWLAAIFARLTRRAA